MRSATQSKSGYPDPVETQLQLVPPCARFLYPEIAGAVLLVQLSVALDDLMLMSGDFACCEREMAKALTVNLLGWE